MKRAVGLVVVALVLLAILLLREEAREVAPIAKAPPAPPTTPRRVQAPASPPRKHVSAALIGVNEGLTLPPTTLMRLGGAMASRAALSRRTALLAGVGAGVVRANSHLWPHLNHHQFRGFSDPDAFMKTAGAAGLDVILVIGPWPGSRTSAYTPRYVPDDLDAYATWVGSIVERYDGDGADDMPDLVRPVLAWEVDNEPDLHHRVRPNSAGGSLAEGEFETAEEYATVLKATSAAVRAADPTAIVLSGGLFNPWTIPVAGEYLRQVLAVPGARDAIDGVSVHAYFATDNLDPIRETMEVLHDVAPGLRVWVTETSVPVAGDRDEDWQGRMTAAVLCGFLAEGAERVLWHTLADASDDRAEEGHHGFATNSLYRMVEDGDHRTFERKPAGDVFRRVADHLAGLVREDVVEVPATGGRLLETPDGWIAFWGEPARPPGATGPIVDLLTGEPAERAVSPAWIGR